MVQQKMSDVCQPPEHLRGVHGWHWVEYQSGFRTLKRWWLDRTEWKWAQTSAEDISYCRYLAPAPPPAVVAGLVEALTELAEQDLTAEMTPGHRAIADYEGAYNSMVDVARAALAAYREAGR